MTSPPAPRPPAGRGRAAERAAPALVLALAVGIIWWPRYLPTQDGPIHLYSAYVLNHLGDPAAPAIGAAFTTGSPWTPYWTAHLALAGLLRVLPPRAAERTLLTGYVFALAAALRAWGAATGGWTPAAAVLVAPLCFTRMFHMGYWNFCLALPVFFFGLAGWWRALPRPRPRDGFRLGGLLLLAYFTHLLVAALLVATVVALWALSPGPRRRGAAILAAALLPGVVLGAGWAASHAVAARNRWDLSALAGHLAGFGVIGGLTPGDAGWTAAFAAAFWVCAVLGLVRSRGAAWRRPVAVVAGTTLLAYLLVPDGTGVLAGSKSVGFAMSFRLAIIPVLALLPALDLPAGRWRAPALAAVTALAACLLLRTGRRFAALGEEVGRYVAAAPALAPGVRLVVVNGDAGGEPIGILRHARAYFSLATGGADLSTTFADEEVYPVRYRLPAGATRPPSVFLEADQDRLDPASFAEGVDVVLGWRWPAGSPLPARLGARYRRVASRDGMEVLGAPHGALT